MLAPLGSDLQGSSLGPRAGAQDRCRPGSSFLSLPLSVSVMCCVHTMEVSRSVLWYLVAL